MTAAAKPKPFKLTRPEPTEAQVLHSVLRALAACPSVACHWRQNTGGAWLPGAGGRLQPVKFGFAGSPDIHGFMRDGRALYIEVKKPSGRVTPEQKAFIARAQAAGCVAFVARSIDDVFRELKDRAPDGARLT